MGKSLSGCGSPGRGYALRFLAYRQRHYVTLGTEHDDWARHKAEDELQNMLADVRRGIWIPPDRTRTTRMSARPGEDGLTFHRFASDRLAARKGEVAPRTYEFDAWALHAVDYYRRHEVQQAELRGAAIERGAPSDS